MALPSPYGAAYPLRYATARFPWRVRGVEGVWGSPWWLVAPPFMSRWDYVGWAGTSRSSRSFPSHGAARPIPAHHDSRSYQMELWTTRCRSSSLASGILGNLHSHNGGLWVERVVPTRPGWGRAPSTHNTPIMNHETLRCSLISPLGCDG